MNKIIAILFALMISVASFAGINEQNPETVFFNVGTSIASEGAVSNCFRVDRASTIESIYIVDQAGIATDATDTVTITLYLNNSAYGNFVTSTAAITANTGKLLTPTATKLAAGDVLQIRVTKGGAGKATTAMGVTLSMRRSNSN